MKKANIKTINDVKTFFNSLIFNYGLSFHPDTNFDDYVNKDGSKVFGDEKASEMDSIMNQAFDLCDIFRADIYGIALEVFNSFEKSHIQAVRAEQTGGGVMVDYITLKDDYQIGVTDETVVYMEKADPDEYSDEIDYTDIIPFGDDFDFYAEDADERGIGFFIDTVENVTNDDIIFFDIIVLKSGITISIDDAVIVVHKSKADYDNDAEALSIINRK